MTIPPHNSHHLRRSRRGNGFSIVEMLVATACLGILLGASIQVTNNALRREEGLAVALAVAGWLEEIQRNATRFSQPCRVTFNASLPSGPWKPINPGEPIASVLPENCAVEPVLLLPRTGFSQQASTPERKPFQIAVSYSSKDPLNGPDLIFTPTGGVTLTFRYVFHVRNALASNQVSQRCVRITSVVGSIGVGKVTPDTSGLTCKTETYDGTI